MCVPVLLLSRGHVGSDGKKANGLKARQGQRPSGPGGPTPLNRTKGRKQQEKKARYGIKEAERETHRPQRSRRRPTDPPTVVCVTEIHRCLAGIVARPHPTPPPPLTHSTNHTHHRHHAIITTWQTCYAGGNATHSHECDAFSCHPAISLLFLCHRHQPTPPPDASSNDLDLQICSAPKRQHRWRCWLWRWWCGW